MIKAILLLLIGAAAGAWGYYYFINTPKDSPAAESTAQKSPAPGGERTLTQRVRDDVQSAADAVTAKLAEWRLTPDEIRKDMEHTGQVVRTKATKVGEAVAGTADNARIITSIKTIIALEKDLPAFGIEVDCDKGEVTLRGNVDSPDAIARAISLSLDTEGVHKVRSQLTTTAAKN